MPIEQARARFHIGTDPNVDPATRRAMLGSAEKIAVACGATALAEATRQALAEPL